MKDLVTLNSPTRRSSRLDQRHWKHGCRRLTACSVTTKLLVVTDRRPPRRLADAVTGVHSSVTTVRYAGAMPCRHWYTVAATRNWIRSGLSLRTRIKRRLHVIQLKIKSWKCKWVKRKKNTVGL